MSHKVYLYFSFNNNKNYCFGSDLACFYPFSNENSSDQMFQIETASKIIDLDGSFGEFGLSFSNHLPLFSQLIGMENNNSDLQTKLCTRELDHSQTEENVQAPDISLSGLNFQKRSSNTEFVRTMYYQGGIKEGDHTVRIFRKKGIMVVSSVDVFSVVQNKSNTWRSIVHYREPCEKIKVKARGHVSFGLTLKGLHKCVNSPLLLRPCHSRYNKWLQTCVMPVLS